MLDPTGPRVVAIGGGHGLARTLGAARRYASTITAIVSVADDGGSSGRLRALLGIPAPGDVRRCLGALAPRGSLLGQALEHRFDAGALDGHAFGNLLLAALTARTGDFVVAVEEAGRLIGALGDVVPATAGPVVLNAQSPRGDVVEGQVKVMGRGGPRRVFLEPAKAKVPRAALEAIEAADQIVIGPGSLYTSLLAALAPEPIATALRSAGGRRIYVCNLCEQVPETQGYDVGDHVHALVEHGVPVDAVLVDTVGVGTAGVGTAGVGTAGVGTAGVGAAGVGTAGVGAAGLGAGLVLGRVPEGIEIVMAAMRRGGETVHDPELLASVLAGQVGRG